MSKKKKCREDRRECGSSRCPSPCDAEQASGCCTLNHLKVALIGGLDRLENQYRSVFESLGTVRFYFHTGCCNGSGANRLRASAQDADIVVFITRINSHNALSVIKGICRKSGKSFLAGDKPGTGFKNRAEPMAEQEAVRMFKPGKIIR